MRWLIDLFSFLKYVVWVLVRLMHRNLDKFDVHSIYAICIVCKCDDGPSIMSHKSEDEANDYRLSLVPCRYGLSLNSFAVVLNHTETKNETI